jgi:hypothetical protein
MTESANNRDWSLWMNLAVWGSMLLLTGLDFFDKRPPTLVWILRYSALPIVIVANFFRKSGRVRWLLAGIAVGLLLGSFAATFRL